MNSLLNPTTTTTFLSPRFSLITRTQQQRRHSSPLHSTRKQHPLLLCCCSRSFSSKPITQQQTNPIPVTEDESPDESGQSRSLFVGISNPIVPSFVFKPGKLGLSDQAFFLLAFVASTTCVAFISLVIAAVPTLWAMGRAANSLAKLADTAREELPSTMAAIRLSGMEISDLTLELSDLSQEIADGVNKSTQAVQAAEAGIRQIGALAHHHTVSMIEERANLPVISLQPIVAGAAKKTSRAVGRATKTIMNIISLGEFGSGSGDYEGNDRFGV